MLPKVITMFGDDAEEEWDQRDQIRVRFGMTRFTKQYWNELHLCGQKQGMNYDAISASGNVNIAAIEWILRDYKRMVEDVDGSSEPIINFRKPSSDKVRMQKARAKTKALEKDCIKSLSKSDERIKSFISTFLNGEVEFEKKKIFVMQVLKWTKKNILCDIKRDDAKLFVLISRHVTENLWTDLLRNKYVAALLPGKSTLRKKT